MAGEASGPSPWRLAPNCFQGLVLLQTRGPRVSARPLPSPLRAPPPLQPCWLPESWTAEAARSPASPGHPPGGRRRHCPRHLRPAPRPRPVQLYGSLESKDVHWVSQALTCTPGTDGPICQGPGPGPTTQEYAGGPRARDSRGPRLPHAEGSEAAAGLEIDVPKDVGRSVLRTGWGSRAGILRTGPWSERQDGERRVRLFLQNAWLPGRGRNKGPDRRCVQGPRQDRCRRGPGRVAPVTSDTP